MKESFIQQEKTPTPIKLINNIIKKWHPDRHMGINTQTLEVITQFIDILITLRKFCKIYGVESLENWSDLDSNMSIRKINIPTLDENGTIQITEKMYSTPKDFLTDIGVISSTYTDRAAKLRALRQSRMPQQPVTPTESKSPSPFAKRDKKSNIFD